MAKVRTNTKRKRQAERFTLTEIKGKRKNTWLVTGYKLDGDRIRSRFKTEAEARAEILALSLQTADGALRTIATKLTDSQIEDAQAAIQLLGDCGTLLEAVSFYKINHRETSGLAIKEALAQYMDYKEGRKRSARTTYEINNRVGTFANFVSNRQIDRIRTSDITDFLKQFKGQNCENYRSKLFSFFKWCDKQGLSSGNPVAAIEREELSRDPEFFKPDEVRALLRAARDTGEGELLAYLSIAIFAGLRPDSELKKLTWGGVNFEDAEIQVPKGKTGVARTVKASDNLMAFLAECDRRKPIIPKGSFQRKLAAVKRAAGFKGGVRDSKRLRKIEDEPGRKSWIPDGTRHSFITYFVRESGDIYKTATAAGNSPGVIKAHYEGAATSSEATAFWAITPTTLDNGGKLLKFAG